MKKLLKKSLITLLKVFTFGLIIPLIVFALSIKGMYLSLKYFWPDWYSQAYVLPSSGHQSFAFKLNYVWMSSFCCLTTIYYIFCFLSIFIKRPIIRKWLLAVFSIAPIIYLMVVDGKSDIRISICFIIFHLTYYGLFVIFWYAFSKLQKFKMFSDVVW